VFGPGGIWSELLRRGEGYIETQVEHEFGAEAERQYRVRDFWVGHRGFEIFRERLAEELEEFGRLLVAEGLVERQQLVGEYYEKDPGDDDELVPG
jgi:hypothetical protein